MRTFIFDAYPFSHFNMDPNQWTWKQLTMNLLIRCPNLHAYSGPLGDYGVELPEVGVELPPLVPTWSIPRVQARWVVNPDVQFTGITHLHIRLVLGPIDPTHFPCLTHLSTFFSIPSTSVVNSARSFLACPALQVFLFWSEEEHRPWHRDLEFARSLADPRVRIRCRPAWMTLQLVTQQWADLGKPLGDELESWDSEVDLGSWSVDEVDLARNAMVIALDTYWADGDDRLDLWSGGLSLDACSGPAPISIPKGKRRYHRES